MSRYELTEQSRRIVAGEYIPAAPQQPVINVHVHNHTVHGEESGGITGFIFGAAKLCLFAGVGYFAVMYFMHDQKPEAAFNDLMVKTGLSEKSIEPLSFVEGWYIRIKSAITGDEYGTAPIMWSVPNYTAISSPFGFRKHPIHNTQKMHAGIDIPAPQGTPVIAAGAGIVEFSGITDGGYGNKIIINHGKKRESIYAHLHSVTVKAGQVVIAGTQIGTVGTTGASTGNHLHFEIKVNGSAVDPVRYRADSQI